MFGRKWVCFGWGASETNRSASSPVRCRRSNLDNRRPTCSTCPESVILIQPEAMMPTLTASPARSNSPTVERNRLASRKGGVWASAVNQAGWGGPASIVVCVGQEARDALSSGQEALEAWRVRNEEVIPYLDNPWR